VVLLPLLLRVSEVEYMAWASTCGSYSVPTGPYTVPDTNGDEK